MIDTKIEVAQCNRCQQYVFACQSNGLKTVADPAPLADVGAYVAALAAGRRVFDLHERAGRPHSLFTRSRASRAPTWPPAGGQRPILAEHACATDARAVETVQEAPQTPVCDVWRAQGWNPPATCPRVGSAGLAAAGSLIDAEPPRSCKACDPPPFESGPDCSQCGCPTIPGHFTGMQIGETWIFAYHERCPDVAQAR